MLKDIIRIFLTDSGGASGAAGRDLLITFSRDSENEIPVRDSLLYL